MGQSGCLMADLISYCLCCWETETEKYRNTEVKKYSKNGSIRMFDGRSDLVLPLLLPHPPPSELHCAGHVLEGVAGMMMMIDTYEDYDDHRHYRHYPILMSKSFPGNFKLISRWCRSDFLWGKVNFPSCQYVVVARVHNLDILTPLAVSTTAQEGDDVDDDDDDGR